MGTSGSFFGTIKLPTDLSDICMNDEKDGEQRSLTDTPKRVQANRQLERVHGVPRVAKRLTTSNVHPSPGEGLSEEVVRNIKTPLESIDKGLEEEQLPLMEATVNCEPFEVFVNGKQIYSKLKTGKLPSFEELNVLLRKNSDIRTVEPKDD